jgi:hypothetical protein
MVWKSAMMMEEETDRQEKTPSSAKKMLCFERDEKNKNKLQCPMTMKIKESATKVLYKARTATPTAPIKAAL